VVECIGRGARAFLTKDCGIKKLEQAILRVIALGSYYDDDVAVAIARYTSNKPKTSFNAIDLITKDEIKILELMSLNKNNHEIADILAKSVRTVEGYRSKILAKTGLKSFAAVIPWAIQNRLISGNTGVKSQ
jgi:DNA-binding NarL/FixJ family response regulator